jgi:hypothetical protein
VSSRSPAILTSTPTWCGAVVAWRDFYAPNYVDVFGGNPTAVSTSGKGKDKKEEETERSVAEGQPPPFNPTAEFFLRLFQDYQGQ